MENVLLIKLIKKAQSINICIKDEAELLNCNYMVVRRALARNNSITTKTANELCYDAVENVSYWGSKNINSTTKRVFSENLPICVTCNLDEANFDECKKCDINKKKIKV